MDDQRAGMIRAEDFLTAYNRIDDELRSRLGLDNGHSFRSVVDRFVKSNNWWRRDAEALRTFADLRNVMVHDRFERYRYLSIPSPEVVAEIQAIRERLLKPRTVQDAFAREVFTADVSDSVAALLETVRKEQISQLPVYDGNEFRGLVTSNGVLRWLADRTGREGTTVHLENVAVRDLLELEEDRQNWEFVGRKMPVPEAAWLFADNPLLEALLVTEAGKPGQKLLGIATQWDVSRPGNRLQ